MTMTSFIIFTFYRILLGWLNEAWIRYKFRNNELHEDYQYGNRICLEELGKITYNQYVNSSPVQDLYQ